MCMSSKVRFGLSPDFLIASLRNITKIITFVHTFHYFPAQITTHTHRTRTCTCTLQKTKQVMYFHHIVTLAVVSGSRSRGLHLYGTVIFWIHDVSDIPLDLMKICNLLRLHGYSCFFITEISYFVTVGVWVFQRLYRLPFWLLYSVIIDSTFGEFNGRRTFCSDAESNGTVLDCYILRFSTALLAILLLMHIFWTYLLLRIARRSLYVGEDAHVVGREEYEGHSSDDEQYANSSRITDKSKKVK
eukprot:c9580_g1_i5.p2 GENE.c9580_g1_i5~~c9580_g1_i5.p2  ORF type:complete len:244 (+),score=54.21 c9580_g1_i5:459-1190(+)